MGAKNPKCQKGSTEQKDRSGKGVKIESSTKSDAISRVRPPRSKRARSGLDFRLLRRRENENKSLVGKTKVD